MNVTDGSITKSLGAIINDDKYVESSVKNLIFNIFELSLFNPAIFSFATILIGFAIKLMTVKTANGTVNTVTGIMLIPLSLMLYVVSTFLSSITFLQVIYNLISLLVAVYVFYRVVDYSIKTETYK
jgi:hypothetical protein